MGVVAGVCVVRRSVRRLVGYGGVHVDLIGKMSATIKKFNSRRDVCDVVKEIPDGWQGLCEKDCQKVTLYSPVTDPRFNTLYKHKSKMAKKDRYKEYLKREQEITKILNKTNLDK